MEWLWIVLYLGGGFVLLDKGAVWLVGGGSRIAVRLGISSLAIGLTIVAWGTSLPEVVVSGLAAAKGNPSMSLGTVVGSNVANIGLVVGSSALILPRILARPMKPREIFWLLFSLAALWACLWDREVDRLEAGGLLAFFAVYSLQMWFTARGEPGEDPAGEDDRHPVVHILLGMAAIAVGAWLVTEGGEKGALALGIEKRVVAITVFALGTSLPELTTSVRGALRGECQIALGNVVGSNVFNVLAVIGIVGLIQPIKAVEDPQSGAAFEKVLSLDLPVALGFSLALIVLPMFRGERRFALVLLVGYLTYTGYLYATGQVPA